MKLIATSVHIDRVARVVDILRTLGYTNVGFDQDDPAAAHPAVRVEVLVKDFDAPRAAVALSRATSSDPHPVFVTDVSPLAFAGDASWG